MRVLIVSQYFWPENFRINNLATELAARGLQFRRFRRWTDIAATLLDLPLD